MIISPPEADVEAAKQLVAADQDNGWRLRMRDLSKSYARIKLDNLGCYRSVLTILENHDRHILIRGLCKAEGHRNMSAQNRAHVPAAMEECDYAWRIARAEPEARCAVWKLDFRALDAMLSSEALACFGRGWE